MKIIISEDQLRLLEQIHLGPMLLPGNPMEKAFSPDNVTDIVSAIVDLIPGVGNLVSYGIDVLHAASYAIRFYRFSDTEDEKIYNLVMCCMNLTTAHIPWGAGNIVNITSRSAIKNLLKQTPKEILIIGKRMGIYNGTMIFLSKEKWKFMWLLLLAKIFGNSLQDDFSKWISNLEKMKEKFKKVNKEIYESLVSVEDLLKEMREFIPIAIKISQNLNF